MISTAVVLIMRFPFLNISYDSVKSSCGQVLMSIIDTMQAGGFYLNTDNISKLLHRFLFIIDIFSSMK